MPPEASGARLADVPEAFDDDYPWPSGPWVRALFVMTLDGHIAGPDGSSRSISGPADRAVLGAVRRWADAVIVGAATMRAERYNPMRVAEAVSDARRARGLGAAPRLVIVSGSLDLPWGDAAYTESALPPLIVTCTSATADARARVPETCELLVAPGDRVDPVGRRAQLGERGLDRIVLEGGPTLLADFARAGMVDEWALSLSGILEHDRFAPVLVGCEDEFVFTRFIRQGDS
jgi:riboflavin biosynthesis pyrimidine reductase